MSRCHRPGGSLLSCVALTGAPCAALQVGITGRAATKAEVEELLSHDTNVDQKLSLHEFIVRVTGVRVPPATSVHAQLRPRRVNVAACLISLAHPS